MSNQLKLIREKETFRYEHYVDVDGEDVKVYVKASVNYERLTYKVQPVITMIHGFGEDVQQGMLDAVSAARTECENRLAKYREEAGIGHQGDLFGDSAPSA